MDLYLIIGLVFLAAQLVIGVAVLFSIRFLVAAVMAYPQALKSFFISEGETPAPAVLVLESYGHHFDNKFRMSQMGKASGDARAEKAASQEMVEDLVATEQPLLAAMLDQAMPKWSKILAKHPAGAGALLKIGQSLMKSSGGNVSPKSGANGAGGPRQTSFNMGGE